jgi:hypothetical protein
VLEVSLKRAAGRVGPEGDGDAGVSAFFRLTLACARALCKSGPLILFDLLHALGLLELCEHRRVRVLQEERILEELGDCLVDERRDFRVEVGQ